MTTEAADAADVLAPLRKRWGLTPDGDAFATATSVLQPVRRESRPAFLKLATEAEERAGGLVLRWWQGRGAVAVLDADGDALLLERAEGERDLARLAASGPEGDDEATRILCRVGRRLHTAGHTARPEGLADLPRWFRELPLQAAASPDAHDGLYPCAAAEATALLAHPADDVVLHADLHHGNVLDFGERGWLAIDPKPVHGDPGFDVANILCNPGAEVALRPGRLERAVAVIADETGMEARLVLRWTLAWAGLSAAWSERSGGDATVAIAVGRRARALLDG